MPSNAELFVEHLDCIFGEEDAIHSADAPDGGPPISVFVYNNVPEEGMITGVTYGLSLCPHPQSKKSRPEIIVSVQSQNLDWPIAAATFAALNRGEKTFSYGDVFTTDCPVASDSKMEGFLVFAQSILSNEDALIQLNDYQVTFSQFYPIYRSELAVYEKIGLESFWKHKGFDMYDIKRKPIKG